MPRGWRDTSAVERTGCFAEDATLASSSHVTTDNPVIPVLGDLMPSSSPMGTHALGTRAYRQAKPNKSKSFCFYF